MILYACVHIFIFTMALLFLDQDVLLSLPDGTFMYNSN